MAFGENPTPVDPVDNNETTDNNIENTETLNNYDIYKKAELSLQMMNNYQGNLSIQEDIREADFQGSKGETISASSYQVNKLYAKGEIAPKEYGPDITFIITKYNEQTQENKDTIIKILGTGEIEIDGTKIPDDLKEKVLTKIETEISEIVDKKEEIKEKQNYLVLINLMNNKDLYNFEQKLKK